MVSKQHGDDSGVIAVALRLATDMNRDLSQLPVVNACQNYGRGADEDNCKPEANAPDLVRQYDGHVIVQSQPRFRNVYDLSEMLQHAAVEEFGVVIC